MIFQRASSALLLLFVATVTANPLQTGPQCILRASSTQIDLLPTFWNEGGVVPMSEDKGGWRIEARIGQEFTAVCTGANNTLKNFNQRDVTVWCDHFGRSHTKYGPVTLDDLRCSILVTETIVRAGTCNSQFSKINICLDNVPFIEVCHDESRSESLWSLHTLNGPDLDKSESYSGSSFKEGEFYPDIDANQCYTQVEQIKTVAEILGSDAQANKYIVPTKQYFFSRGHLTANADGIWLYERKATYYFINVIPQWQIINAGNWERLESCLRNFAQTNRAMIKVYTGASGVMTLKDENNNDKQIYLGKNSSGKLMNVLPVPKFMYKVIINEAANTCVVVVTLNNPYPEYFKQSDILCTSVCPQISWITFDTMNITKGYTYCCDVKTFYNALPAAFPYPGDLPLMK